MSVGCGQLDDNLLNPQQRAINVKDFVEANIKQVSELLQAVDNSSLVSREVTKGPRTVLQRLPRHMRRRAMSYNVKRLPRRHRQYALQFVNLSKHRIKPPSRFRRRRPRNLLQAYARRRRKNVWLETHIWHAKRFFMIRKWGYKIPFRSFQRAFRPSYRDSVHHCVIQDMSFLQCIQVVMKDRSLVLAALRVLFAPQTSLTPISKFAENGKFEITTLFYKPNEYPEGFVGPIRFMWSKNWNGLHSLIIWTHPSTSEQVLKHLITQLDASRSLISTDTVDITRSKDTVDCHDGSCWNSEYFSDSLSCTIIDHREQFSRFRLYGPKSLAILKGVLNVVYEFKSDKEWTHSFKSSNAFWSDEVCFRTFEELPDGLMLNLLVSDPRINMDFKKRKPTGLEKQHHSLFDFNDIPPISSYFWDTKIHKSVLKTRISDEELQKRRRENLPPIELSSSEIPILLIVRNTGVGTSKTFNGVDMIIPAGFARDFWLSLQYRTARAIGYKDQKYIEYESDILNFPYDVPDCDAGKRVLKEEHRQLKTKYIARPCNRRIQYKTALRIRHPFTFGWNHLIRQSHGKETSSAEPRCFYVLRDRSSLKSIDQWLRGKAAEPDILQTHLFSLIPIQIEAKHRGCPARYGYIYVPKKSDLQLFAKQGRFTIMEEPKCLTAEDSKENGKRITEIKGYIELSESGMENVVNLNQLFPDKEMLRKRKKVISKKQKREKFRMAKRRKEQLQITNRDECSEEASVSDDGVHVSKSATDDFQQRRIIGRIVRGDFSFSLAKGKGFGYCIACCLKYIKDGKVLFRNTTSRYYHFAKLSVNRRQISV